MTVLYMLDVNAVAHAAANLGGVVEVSDWTCAYAQPGTPVAVVSETAAHGALVASEYLLETLRRTLLKQGASDFEELDEEAAEQSATAYAALVRSTGGVVVTTADVRKHVPAAQAAVPRHLQGTARGQIDYEDITVIAAALAALDATGADQVILVTSDKGLLNVGPALNYLGVFAVATTRLSAAMKVAA